MSELRYFDIDPEKWLCGTGEGLLLNPQGERCCLGFMGQQIGFSDEMLLNCGLPLEYESESRPADDPDDPPYGDPGGFRDNGLDQNLEDKLVSINDDKVEMSKEVRVSCLNEVLEKAKAPFRFRLITEETQ